MIMDYIQEYTKKFTRAEEAVKMVKSGDRVIYAFGICSINELDRALAMRKDKLMGVEVICTDLSCGYYAMEVDFTEKHFRFCDSKSSGLLGRLGQDSVSQAIAKPRFKKQLIDQESAIDIFMATVSPMDSEGYFWFGVGANREHNLRQYYQMAQCVILEINERILEGKETGQEYIHISQADIIVASKNDELIPGLNTEAKVINFCKERVPRSKNRVV